MKKTNVIKPIHPFPARMASAIVIKRLQKERKHRRTLRILDPMSGSGTTLALASNLGHKAIGFDKDPLAVLLSKVWCSVVDKVRAERTAANVRKRAEQRVQYMSLRDAYPAGADNETKRFVRYWFDATNRKQLAALSLAISRVHDNTLRPLLWCAFSRLIVTKTVGASLAMDVSHSRPHKTYSQAPLRPLGCFEESVKKILDRLPSDKEKKRIAALVEEGDARELPLSDNSVDLVITSPPYLNAIDYLRGHRLTLVWLGYSVSELRTVRSSSIGSETSSPPFSEPHLEKALSKMGKIQALSTRDQGIARRYIRDMDLVLRETRRVLKKTGRAVFVVGDSTIRGTFLQNSKGIKCLAKNNGFSVISSSRRVIPDTSRYLPPPSRSRSTQLGGRMREEVVITLGQQIRTTR